jgi:hypothetical protein
MTVVLICVACLGLVFELAAGAAELGRAMRRGLA